MKTRIPIMSLMLLLATLATPALAADDAYTAMTEHYETVRLALLDDTLDGLAEGARAIEATARELSGHFSPERAGVPAEAAEDARALLPEIAARAEALAQVPDLEAAREALGELTKPLVRYRKLAGATDVQVAYCPMAKKSWLQKDETEIGNPYYGQEMPGCGDFVGN